MAEVLSVIVPVYNAELFLRDCIESILAQEYRDLELLLIDDGSTDGSGKICDEYAEADRRVRVFHTPNSGAAAARNLGINKASGAYLGFVDSDDTIEPQMYRVMMEAAGEANADVVICNLCSVNEDGHKRAVCLPDCERLLRGNDAVRDKLLRRYYQGKSLGLPSLCNKIYCVDFINENNIRIDEELVRAEDYWFNFAVLKKAACVVVLADVLYNYRQINNNSIMHQFRETYYEELKQSHLRLREENKELGFPIERGLHNAFAYKVQQFILAKVKQRRKNRVISIMKDDFYREALAQARLSRWSQWISRLVLAGRYNMAYGLYSIVVYLKSLRRKRDKMVG